MATSTALRQILLGEDPSRELRELARAGDLQELEPRLAALHMEIPKGYHHKDNWEHSLRVLDKAIARETEGVDLILRTAALFHDVGKPATRKFEGKGVVTFHNHEYVGAKQATGLLATHGYSQSERATISNLIRLHMRAYGFGDQQWSESAVRRLSTDAGGEMGRLVSIFYSDLTTTNDRKRKRVEGSIARLEEAIAKVNEKDARAARRPALDGYELMELTGLSQGRELGALMRFLNSDEGIGLTREEAIEELKKRFPQQFS